MSDTTDSSSSHRPSTVSDSTPWQRLADVDPIYIRDPLAELLGMVPEGDPLTVTFADVAKAAGHACPAVAGAYRGTQLGLEDLYPETYPVRTDIEVRIGGDPDGAGIGPMANVIRHITGAADETGFAGFGGYGGRENLLTFGDVSGPGRSFAFTRSDTDETVRISFDPAAVGIDPSQGGGSPLEIIPQLISGEASDQQRNEFYEAWHGRVQRILRASPGSDGPFTLERT